MTRRDYTVELTPEEWARFNRPVNGQGGAQTLLRKLQARATHPPRLLVDEDLLLRSYQYAYRYAASGGFQGRLRAVLKAALRAGWQPPNRLVVTATRCAA